MTNKQYVLVAAIDFGTTFSGYAYSFHNDYKSNPLNALLNNWTTRKFSSDKTSSCILFNPNGKFSNFGYEAEDMYSDLALEEQHEKWYYFRHFKMELYGEKIINRNMTIKDETGKTMNAMKVFSAGIKYLKDHMLNTCEKRLRDHVFANDIQWVLTVPAVWSDSAKQFMRESAEQAGIACDQLLIALEPEVASLYCRYLPMTVDSHRNFTAFKPGSKYLVLDAGGGTIDITVHEVTKKGLLRELHKANGIDLGGTKVDDEFRIFLSEIVGKSAYERFADEHKYDMLDLSRDIELKKKTIKPHGDYLVTLKIPSTLAECCKSETGKDISEQLSSTRNARGKVIVNRDKLRLVSNIVRSMFKRAADGILDHLETLLLHLSHESSRPLTAIMMVGGFSESEILQNAIKSKFETKDTKVIIPQDAGLAVLKGAVIYGHEPRMIESRICKVTYGIATNCDFKPRIHCQSKRWVTTDGRVKCKEVFDVLVREGEIVHVGKSRVYKRYSVIERDQTIMTFQLWQSRLRDPKYVTDMHCQKLGSLRIELPDTSRGLERKAYIEMTFGGTELEVEATDEFTRESVSASFDFL